MIEDTIILAYGQSWPLIIFLGPLVWSGACLTGVIGLILSCFRSRRTSAMVMAYLTIGIVAFLVIWVLVEFWNATMLGDWVNLVILVSLMAIPCAVGMGLILYHRQKNRLPKNAPPPPPRGTEE